MVKFKDVTKKFGNVVALEKVTFEVDKGEFVFITGPSGAGKTTILKLILGEILPDGGGVSVNGVSVGDLSASEIPFYRQGIGTVFQDFKVLPERTVRENVEVALAVIGLSQDEWDGRVKHVLKLVGLEKQIDLFPRQLSGGELQRTSLARALVVNPKILLADEPTGNLDWETSDSIMQIFEKIHKEGKTVIMATHNEEIIKKYKKRVIHLVGGRMNNGKHSS
ncbi:MAG: cell division ATP-binding protein FtsE [Candidatus Woesebacteria bacterium GW2011_GWB1_41_10]|uniref:Cell division ATP-binding protein FtsE n=1 Tax=Candidatus Woesebacteria bacterium GW2011_GWB1_41_10 TaxID=1618577 RepID=A0A0G0WQL2_9BACT|nr:MAG: cell division ATP-binding protein FtsE [Candidatus Woesebacteria bacterium GW2011_GWB1_41_10]